MSDAISVSWRQFSLEPGDDDAASDDDGDGDNDDDDDDIYLDSLNDLC